MKILILVNWKVEYCNNKPMDKQPPDYYVKGEPYWFFRYFDNIPEVDVVDIKSMPWLENLEKNKIRFYVWQTLKMIPKLGKYDLIISHGMQSGVVLSLWKRLFRIKAKHIVFDIGSFNSASESGFALKLLQYASKSIDGLIYHTSSQIDYYKKFFPWIVDKSFFIHFGADFEFFNAKSEDTNENEYIVCAGKNRSDWDTLVEAYSSLNCGAELRLIGGIEEKFDNISGVKQFPYLSVNDFMRQVSGAKLCVLPLNSVKYSFGQMRFLQQMAMEKCVVASRIPSLIDYAQDTKTALFYEPGNVADCANKIKMALESDTLRKNIAKHAHESVVKYYSEKVMAKQIESVFNTVLGERKNG